MSGPNILWLMTDRHHAGALSCAGHPDARTPHLDSIAAEGERFANAYVNNPICAPSRCCFMTGRPVRDHGVGGNYVWESITDDPPTIPRLLRAAGWDTGFIGKAHLPRRWVESGFAWRRYCDLCDTSPHDPLAVDYFRDLVAAGLGDAYDLGRLPAGHPGESNRAFTSAIPYAHSVERWIGDRAIEFLRRPARAVAPDHPSTTGTACTAPPSSPPPDVQPGSGRMEPHRTATACRLVGAIAALFCLLLATGPLTAGEAMTLGTVRGWRVVADADFRISLLRPDGAPGLENFAWAMQAGREKGIIAVDHQSLPTGTAIERLAAAGGMQRYTARRPDGAVRWQATVNLSADAVEIAYLFTAAADIPNAWLMVRGIVPGNQGLIEVDGPPLGRGMHYRLPEGLLQVQYAGNQAQTEPHKPYLASGPRLYVTPDKPFRDYVANTTLGVTVRLVPPSLTALALPDLPLTKQVQIGLAAGRLDSWLLLPGQVLETAAPLRITPAQRTPATATWTAADLRDNVVWRRSEVIDLANCGDSLVVRVPAPPRLGPYRLTLAISRPDGPGRQTEMVTKDVAAFGVRDPVWADERMGAHDAFLGASIHRSPDDDAVLRQARLLGIRWQRCEFETSFTWNNPAEGVFDLNHDRVRRIRALGMEMFGQIAYSPAWAVDATPEERARVGKDRGPHHLLSSRPPRPDAFRAYVRQATTFFKGEISYWEMWNEPHVPIFWIGTPEEFLERLRILHEEVKRSDPANHVLAAGGALLDPFGRRLLKLGAAAFADIWTIHWYIHDIYPEVEAIHAELRDFRAFLDANGGRHLELWNNEGGGENDTMLRDLEHPQWPPLEARRPLDHRNAYALPKLFAIEKAEGIRKHFLYLLRQSELTSGWVAFEKCGAPRPPMYAVAAWGERLEGAAFAERWTRDGLGRAYFFQRPAAGRRPAAALAMLWADLADDAEVPLAIAPADGLQSLDVWGNPLPPGTLSLGVVPVYLEWPGRTVADLQARIAWKDLPRLEHPVLVQQRNRPAGLVLPTIADFPVARELGSSLHPLDLSAACNMGFADPRPGDGQGGWSDEGPFNDFHGVKPGDRTLFGVPFRLIDPERNGGRSVITLKSETVPKGLARAEVPIGRPVRGLFVLHATQNYPREGRAYRLVLTYGDGQTRTCQVTIPGQLNDAWYGPRPEIEELAATKTAAIAVAGEDRQLKRDEIKAMKQRGDGMAWRFVRATWFENPYPAGGAVRSIALESDDPHSPPIILAITTAG